MTKEFLNENKLQFKDCSREDQHILLDALLDTKAERFWHVPNVWHAAESMLNIECIYRTKPIKRLAIPWEHIKPEYRWAAMDENMNLWTYVDEPKLLTDIWHANSQQPLTALTIDVTGINWKDSLVERPADK